MPEDSCFIPDHPGLAPANILLRALAGMPAAKKCGYRLYSRQPFKLFFDPSAVFFTGFVKHNYFC
jgi:hypothetical protein